MNVSGKEKIDLVQSQEGTVVEGGDVEGDADAENDADVEGKTIENK